MSINNSARLGSAVLGRIRLAGYENPNSGLTFQDSLTFSDSFTLALSGSEFSFADGISFQDSFLLQCVEVISLSDSYTLSDFFSNGTAVIGISINDSLDALFLDAITGTVLQPALLFQDTLSIQDAPLPNLFYNYIFNDSFSLSDSLVLENLFVRNIQITGDILNIQDLFILQFNAGLYLTLNDSQGGNWNDVLFDVTSLPLVFIDNLKNWTDLMALGKGEGSGFLLEDFYILGDSVFLRLVMNFNNNDLYLPQDSLFLSKSNTTQTDVFGDVFTLNDNIFLQSVGVISIPLNDSFSLSDSFTISIPEPLNNYLRRYLNDVVT